MEATHEVDKALSSYSDPPYLTMKRSPSANHSKLVASVTSRKWRRFRIGIVLSVFLIYACTYYMSTNYAVRSLQSPSTASHDWFVAEESCNGSTVCTEKALYPNKLQSISPKIWQTSDNSERGDSWTRLNIGYRYELLLDAAAEALVKDFSNLHAPELFKVYKQIATPILRFDLLRYLVLYSEGGYYTDYDTEPRVAIGDWIPDTFDRSTINFVVGVEADEPSESDKEMREKGFTANFQLCQWTLGANARHPILKAVINSIITDLKKERKPDGWPSRMDILETTGPGVFTRAVLAYLEEENPNFNLNSIRTLTSPMQIKDVLLLPQYAFAHFGTYTTREKTSEQENAALVYHESLGSWKTDENEPMRKKDGSSDGFDRSRQDSNTSAASTTHETNIRTS